MYSQRRSYKKSVVVEIIRVNAGLFSKRFEERENVKLIIEPKEGPKLRTSACMHDKVQSLAGPYKWRRGSMKCHWDIKLRSSHRRQYGVVL